MNKPDLAELVITQVRSVTTIYTESNVYHKRAARSCWALIYKWEGETAYTCGNEAVISNAEHPVILPKGCAYEWICRKAGRFTCIDFDAEGEYTDILPLCVSDGDRLLSRLQKLEHAQMLRAPYWKLELLGGTYEILTKLLRTEPKSYVPQDKAQKLRPALEYILGHYTEPITNEQLGSLSGMSTVYFRKLFTETVGMSPIRYIQHLRIRKAKEMLRSDCGSISDVARSLGFQNIYHFSKAFKAQTGVSPSAYMRKKREEK